MIRVEKKREEKRVCLERRSKTSEKKLREKEKGEYFPRNEYVILREIEGGKERSEK